MKSRKYIVYGVVIVLIVAGIYGLVAFGKKGIGSGQASSQPTAYVESDTISVSFKVAGRIKDVLVDEGDMVKKGQVIARLESQELNDKTAQAQAALQAAQANVTQAQAGVSQAKAGIVQAQAGVTQAQAAVGVAEAKKQQGNVAVKVTSQSAASKIAQAQAAANAAKAKWEAVKSGARPEEITQAKVSVDSAKKTLNTANKSLERAQKLFDAGLAADASLDDAKMKQQQAAAQYEAAVQKLKLAQNGSRQEEIDAAKAQYEQALAAVKEAQAGAGQVDIQAQDVKAAEASVHQAQGAVSQADGTVAQAQAAYEQAQSMVEAARSQVAQAKAALQEAKTYVGYTELRAPVDGVVKSRSLHAGEMASAGYTIYSLETSNQRWAKFYINETQLHGLKVGDPVTVKLLSDGSEVKGKVKVIDAAADFAIQKPSQSSGDTDIRAFGVKVLLTGLSAKVPTGATVIYPVQGEQ
ncbi:HlyD family secretion protein [Paenibacillus wulumuqiensis]|uniref:HlyD family secretion protein n=1 Tax=Paenibacillus wulumuqiensis TaxID=1567107 RepID=UPI0006190D41|nr:biotin/lipoyl-binding protein [Paenibacillus wulumuqiensis]